MYNHNKAQQSKNRVHISWDILYDTCVHSVTTKCNVLVHAIWDHIEHYDLSYFLQFSVLTCYVKDTIALQMWIGNF